MIVIETERLILRHLVAEDAGFILRLVNDPEFIRYIGDRGVRTLDDARAYITRIGTDSYAKNGFGLYMTQLKEAATPIGMCGLVKRDGLDDIDIGFAFMPDFRARGYGFESAKALLEHARRDLGLARIVAITSRDNTGSIALLGKLGLRFERMIRLPDAEDEISLFTTEP